MTIFVWQLFSIIIDFYPWNSVAGRHIVPTFYQPKILKDKSFEKSSRVALVIVINFNYKNFKNQGKDLDVLSVL